MDLAVKSENFREENFASNCIQSGDVNKNDETIQPERSDENTDDGLEWKDGIGYLPGSDMKFRKDEFGGIELIMDDSKVECDESERRLEHAPDLIPREEKFNPDNFFADLNPKEAAVNLSTNLEMKIEPLPNGGYGENHVKANEISLSTNHNETIDQGGEMKIVPYTPTNVKEEWVIKSNNGDSPMQVDASFQDFSKPIQGHFELPGATNDSVIRLATVTTVTSRELVKIPQSPSKHQLPDFNWSKYLKQQNCIAVPVSAFEEITDKPAFPISDHKFSVGDLLEGVDPQHQSLISVVSVAEVKGYRMRLHFEGYSTLHDYWVNADDRFIFPCGFSKKSGRKLHPPKGYTSAKFFWKSHAKANTKILTTEENFPNDIDKYLENNTKFQIGDKLEAVDRKNTELICVATVTDIMDNHVLIHFDGWNHNFDYWCDTRSNYIHPVGWCQSVGKELAMPQDNANSRILSWENYLNESKSKAAPKEAFSPRISHGFEIGMKLEVVDKRNPILIRVASVFEKNSYQLKIHFDGWDKLYDYWIDVDSPNLHPAGWCKHTGHPLYPNITPEDKQPWQSGCPIPGCRGMGHIKGSKFIGHHSEYGCPYSPKNLDSYPIQDRIAPRRGPKPSSLLSRRIVITPNVKEKMSVNDTKNCGKKAVSLRRTSRNSISGGRKSDQDSDFSTDNDALSNHSSVLPAKRKVVEREPEVQIVEKRSLHYSMFQSPLWSSVPNKQLAVYWEQFTRFPTGLKGVRASEICKWSAQEVADFVEEITGHERHGQAFLNEEIDGEAFLLLTQNHISKVLNIKLGPTLKIHNAILYARVNQ